MGTRWTNVQGVRTATIAEAATGVQDGHSPYGLRPIVEFMSSPEGLQLALAFTSIKEPKVRKRVLDLVKSLAEDKD